VRPRLILRCGRGRLRRRRRRRALLGRHPIATIAAAVAAMRPRLREVAIEYLLLLGRQHGANLAESIPEQLMPLMLKILPRLRHFEPRIAQDVADAIALRRRQLKLMIHSLDQPRPRHPQVMIPVRQGAERETNQKARDSHHQAEQEIRLSWQGRSLSSASRAPMDRLRFRNSYSPRVSIAPRPKTHSAPASKDTPRCSRIQRSPPPPTSPAIDSAAATTTSRAIPTRIAAACLPARTRAGPAAIREPHPVPSRHTAPAPSARRRETHDRTSRIPSDAPAARPAARPSRSCAIVPKIPVVLQNNS